MKGESTTSREYTKPITEAKPVSTTSSQDPCLSLSFTTSLQFTEAKALSKVKLHDNLDLRLHKTLNRVEVLNLDNEVCGAIINKELLTIINCIKKGHSFNANVTKLTVDSCTVLVQNANR